MTTSGKVQTLSAAVTLAINFGTGVITGTLSSFSTATSTSATALPGINSLPITGTLDRLSPRNLSGALVAAGTSSAAGTGDGVLEGTLIGTGSLTVSEVVGRLRFNTTDNRRVLMAFGLK